MLFDAQALCAVECLRETTDSDGVQEISAAVSVVLVSRGSAAVSAPGGKTAGLAAGSLLLAAGGLQIAPGANCHAVCVGLAGQAAEALALGLAVHEGLLAADGGVCPAAPQAVAELMAAWRRRAGQAALCAAACQLICAVAHADEAPARAVMPGLVGQAVLAIQRHYAELYGVEELSSQLGVSKSHLVRVFNKAMGVGPGQYLTQVRLEAAKAMLAGRDWPLETVAGLCGFSGANYFCKVFKRYEGCTPTQWRTRNAGGWYSTGLEQREKTLYV